MSFDVDALRMPASQLSRTQIIPLHAPRPRTGEPFLKGPIPWRWLCVAFSLPGKAGAVAVALWQRIGITNKRTVKLSYSQLLSMGVNRYAAIRSLKQLEGAKLVSVRRRSGCAPEVTVLDAPKQPNSDK